MYKQQVDSMPDLQSLQNVNGVVFLLALFAWVQAARKIPKYRGLVVAPIFYCFATVVFYVMDYFFNSQAIGNTTAYTIASAYLRLVGGLLLLGIAIIVIAEYRERGK